MEQYRMDLNGEQLYYVYTSLKLVCDLYRGNLDISKLHPLTDELHRNMGYKTGDTIKKLNEMSELLDQLKIIIWGDNRQKRKVGDIASKLFDMYSDIESVEPHTPEDNRFRLSSTPRIKVTKLTKDVIRDENIDDLLT